MARARRKTLKKRFSHLLKRRARPALNRFLARFSEIGDPAVFENRLFPWTATLEDHFDEIRAEVVRLAALHDVLPSFSEVSPYQERISRDADWKTVWLYGFGYDSEVAQRLCPVTTRLVKQVPELQSALFSMLGPGAHVRAHHGVYKGLVNYHLGVIIPKQAEKCRMQVGDELIVWQAGQSYVFDDTNTHEVWNESGEERIVLMLQFHRPLRQPGRLLSHLFLWGLRLTPYLRTPRKNVRTSDARLRDAAEKRGLFSADGGTRGEAS